MDNSLKLTALQPEMLVNILKGAGSRLISAELLAADFELPAGRLALDLPAIGGDLGHGDFDLVASDFDDGDGSDGDAAFDAHVLPPLQVVGVERLSLDCAYITMPFRLYPVGYRKYRKNKWIIP